MFGKALILVALIGGVCAGPAAADEWTGWQADAAATAAPWADTTDWTAGATWAQAAAPQGAYVAGAPSSQLNQMPLAGEPQQDAWLVDERPLQQAASARVHAHHHLHCKM